MGKIKLILGAAILLLSGQINASLIVVDANEIPIGTNITNAFEGLTIQELTKKTDEDGSPPFPPVETKDVFVDLYPCFIDDLCPFPILADTGNLLAYRDIIVDGFDVIEGFNALQVISDKTITSFSHSSNTGSGDELEIYFFDKYDEFIGETFSGFFQEPCFPPPPEQFELCFASESFDLTQYGDVRSIVFGSWSSSSRHTSFSVTVPEPSIVALFGIGLIGLIGFSKRRKAV